MANGKKAGSQKTAARVTKAEGLELYRIMKQIRVFEEASASQYMRGRIRGFLHLYIGEEAIAAGAIPLLAKQDYITTHYRDHGHALARGMSPNAAMAELFGRATGSSKGKGGSMHLIDANIGMMGGYAIVGGQLPLGVGLALANNYKGNDSIVLTFLGDGALSEGEFHEAMNLAAIWKLPIIFFCENNLYGMGAPVSEVFAVKDIYKIAEPYGIPSLQVDGMDVLAVRDAMRDVVRHVRQGNGPYFVEALAYRFRGHSMADPNEYRNKAEEEFWKQRDPITSFRAYLVNELGVAEADIDALDQEVDAEIEAAVKFAEESPEPDLSELHTDITA
ncbi:MAG: pyruvate dehydrogenase (acetyl-transferring) E1 component subunit alpha [SAR202 cluster bacterium]|nr:pyruvate dehydrogenase (acetyl-transferring) E1 component subunit alpha [SAR202 cluster bacterium]